MNDTSTTPARGANKSIIVAIVLLAIVAVFVFVIMPRISGDSAKPAPTADMTELERGALRDGVLTLSDKPMLADRWERVLQPFEAIEFKYTMAEGQPMVFNWSATAPVEYDLHSHPFDGGTEMTEGFGADSAQEMHGLYVAPFSGIHGWFWENRSMEPVTLTLEATGGFTSSTVYEGPVARERAIPGATPDGAAPITHEMRESAGE